MWCGELIPLLYLIPILALLLAVAWTWNPLMTRGVLVRYISVGKGKQSPAKWQPPTDHRFASNLKPANELDNWQIDFKIVKGPCKQKNKM